MARVCTRECCPEDTAEHRFVPHFLPDTVPSDCPLPQNPTGHLATLLTQTKSHLHSADANYLLEKAATAMIKKLVESLGEKNRLVDCLPSVDQWGKAVWEGIPDTGVEVSFGRRAQLITGRACYSRV